MSANRKIRRTHHLHLGFYLLSTYIWNKMSAYYYEDDSSTFIAFIGSLFAKSGHHFLYFDQLLELHYLCFSKIPNVYGERRFELLFIFIDINSLATSFFFPQMVGFATFTKVLLRNWLNFIVVRWVFIFPSALYCDQVGLSSVGWEGFSKCCLDFQVTLPSVLRTDSSLCSLCIV